MKKTTLIIIALCLMTITALAQAESTGVTTPAVSYIDLAIGTLVSFAITFLKSKVPFIEKHPKIVVTLLSLVITGVTAYAGARGNSGVWPFVISILTQLGAAIGTHEVVTKPVQSLLSDSADDTIRRS